MRLPFALVALLSVTSSAVALPDGYLDPSNVTLKSGKLQIENANEAKVNFTVINKTDKSFAIVAVTCTALVNDEPVETNSNPLSGVGPDQTVYGSVSFLELRGNPDATASCRVEYLKLDR